MLIFIIIILFLLFVFFFIISLYYYNNNNPNFNEDIHHDCKYKRWGCCNDNLTVRLDPFGTNCRGF
jgi:hypothetical protein